MRRFELEAEAGTTVAIAAQAIVFDDGVCVERWFGPVRRTTIRDSVGGSWISGMGNLEGGGPRRFHLDRDLDVSGVSGTGVVAHGAVWADGAVILRWLGLHPSTVAWPSLDDAVATHGHNGTTRIVWIDPEPDVTEPKAGR